MDKPLVTLVPAHTNNYSKNIYPKTGIVLHWIVGSLASADKTFQDPNRIASVQYGIGKNGEIHQYVDDKYTAYHAGVSRYNQNYFGIEHEGGHLYNGERVKPSQACHESSIKLVAWLCKTYNIPCDRKHILKHSETGYATQCCGTLDIDYIVTEASKLLSVPSMSIPQETIDFVRKFLPTFNQGANLTHPTSVGLESWLGVSGIKEFINEIETLRVSEKSLNDTIAKLNASIGGLTTDRNKYKSLVEGIQPTIDGLNSTINTLNIELEGAKKALRDKSFEYDRLEQEAQNWRPNIERLEKLNHQQEQKIKTQAEIITRLEEKLRKANENTKYMGMVELIKKMSKVIADAVRNLLNKRHKKS